MFIPSVSIINESSLIGEHCDNPSFAKNFWFKEIASLPIFDSQKEHLAIICVDTKLRVIDWNLVSVGTINECLAYPREIFRPAICLASYGFILMHNHPSGQTIPSEGDRRLTTRVREGASILLLQFIDHVIVGKDSNDIAYSFRDSGLL